jgi:hypothetical protein
MGAQMTETPTTGGAHNPGRWPHQSECDSFYGDPRGGDHANRHWESENLVYVDCPYLLWYELSTGKRVRVPRVYVHHKVAASLLNVFASVHAAYDHMAHDANPDHAASVAEQEAQTLMDAAGVSNFSGAFNFRLMRNGHSLSMHSYGIALDFDAEHNPFGYPGRFKASSPLVMAFEAEGWTWGGRWRKPDAMHFQAARV